jgi:acyl dehydratase
VTGVRTEPFSVGALGLGGDEHAYFVTADAIRAYAQATDDTARAARSGEVAPPVFAIVPAWPTIAPASRAVASDAARTRVVHYEQDIVLHRPLVPGLELYSRATPVALLGRPNGTSLVIRIETRTESGELVTEQYVTEFFRGFEAPDSIGKRAPDHRLETDGEPLAEIAYPVADDQTVRYAAASGDDFAIHLDDEFARSVGLPGRIVHGLCAMAFTGRAVLEAAGVDDPGAVRRLAVRFSAPLFPGDTLTTRIWSLGDRAFGFEAASSDGTPVIKDGRAELR